MAEMNDGMDFDVLLGATRDQVAGHLGRPDMDMLSLMIYQRNENFLVLRYSTDEKSKDLQETVDGYVVISSKNQVLAKGIDLIGKDGVEIVKHCENVSELLKKYGSACIMGGSTFERPMFFTDYGTVLILITVEDDIRKVKELTIHQLLGN